MYRYYITYIFLFAITFVVEAQDFRRADSLLAVGKYALAAVEYERCHFQATSHDVSHQALRKKSECYKKLQRYDLAAQAMKRCRENYSDYLELVTLLYLADDFEHAAEESQNAELMFDTIGADMLLLWTLSLNEQQYYDSARRVCHRIAKLYDNSAAINDSIDAIYSDTPRLKSKSLAHWLSIFPGLGHLYAGYPLVATIACVSSAAPIGFGVWQLTEHYYLTAYLVGAGLLNSTYFGTMQSATDHAKRTNHRRAAKFNEATRNRLIDVLF